jgi:RIO-like serine/threonine protein kinase
MEETIVKELKGYSGSKIYLMQNAEHLFIRKIGNVERNHERLNALFGKYNIPKIYSKNNQTLDMEYIHGLDMKNYLRTNSTANLIDFVVGTIRSFSLETIDKDYTEVYNSKLEWIKTVESLPFTKDELISKLPKVLPQSQYHGDLTLENIIKTDDEFYMIDAVTIEYDSWVFDIAKLRQDLECGWFLRKSNLMLDVKLKNIQDKILNCFPLANNNYLLILMLLRVLAHAPKGSFENKFILKEIKKLWK